MHAHASTDHRGRVSTGVIVLLVALLCGCSASPSPVTSSVPAPAAPSTTASASILDRPTIAGTFSAGKDDVDLAIRCWGTGSPVIVMEGGSGEGGLHRWGPGPT